MASLVFVLSFVRCSHTRLFNPQGDAGVTGRKIIVDTYGGWGAHGGGAFSGKDFSKVDRSAAYAARWVAKSLVQAKLCRRVLVQVRTRRWAGVTLCTFVAVSEGGKKQQQSKKRDYLQLVNVLQVSYAIGVAHPLSISLFTYGSSAKTETELLQIVNKNFDLRPGVIVR